MRDTTLFDEFNVLSFNRVEFEWIESTALNANLFSILIFDITLMKFIPPIKFKIKKGVIKYFFTVYIYSEG